MRKTLVTLMMVILVLVTATANAVNANVTADVLNLHDEPKGEIVGSVRNGEKVEVLEGPDRHGYYRIIYNGKEYYAYGEYLDFGTELPEMPKVGAASSKQPTSSPTTEPTNKKKMFVSAEMYFLADDAYYEMVFVNAKKEVSLRKYAEKEALRLGWAQRGEPLLILNPRIRNGFVKVRTLDGEVEGYTMVRYLSAEPIEEFDYSEFEKIEILDSEIEGVCWTYAFEDE